jgi:deoxyhypusine synthase
VDVIVTTAGGIEEDLIKCLAPTYRGDFTLPGALLRSRGLNRIGNLLVPNDNYCKFEHWIMPILDKMLLEQSTQVSNQAEMRPKFHTLIGASCSSRDISMFFMVSGRGFLSCLQNVWTPSKVIARLGKEINDESSYLYWAYKVISKLNQYVLGRTWEHLKD